MTLKNILLYYGFQQEVRDFPSSLFSLIFLSVTHSVCITKLKVYLHFLKFSLHTERDIWEFRQCIKLTREIFAQKAFEKFRGPEIQPGSHVQSDKEIDAFIRQKADSAYHPSCTCKMGQLSDSTAVVDPQTKVIGVDNLRVVDASIMPSIVSGNLNAPTIMIAEKAADIIKGLPSLQERNVPVYKPKTLETQR